MAILQELLPVLYRYFGRDVEEIRANRPGYLLIAKCTNEVVEVAAPELSREWWWNLLSVLIHLEKRNKAVAAIPRVSTMLEGRHRLQLNMGAHVPAGVACTIRLEHARDWTLGDYGASKAQIDRIKRAVVGRENIIISGGTGTGKTAFANALLRMVDQWDRTLVVEDAAELKCDHLRDMVRLRPPGEDNAEEVSYSALMNDAVRHSPTRLLVGELRMDNTWLVVKALNVGSEGFIGTIHANNSNLVMEAIVTNVLASGIGIPRETVETIVGGVVTLLIHIRKDHDSGRRYLDELRDIAAERETTQVKRKGGA